MGCFVKRLRCLLDGPSLLSVMTSRVKRYSVSRSAGPCSAFCWGCKHLWTDPPQLFGNASCRMGFTSYALERVCHLVWSPLYVLLVSMTGAGDMPLGKPARRKICETIKNLGVLQVGTTRCFPARLTPSVTFRGLLHKCCPRRQHSTVRAFTP